MRKIVKCLDNMAFFLLLYLIQLCFYLIPALIFALMLILLPACAPQPLRIDVTCTSLLTPDDRGVIINCADAQTWREYNERRRMEK